MTQKNIQTEELLNHLFCTFNEIKKQQQDKALEIKRNHEFVYKILKKEYQPHLFQQNKCHLEIKPTDAKLFDQIESLIYRKKPIFKVYKQQKSKLTLDDINRVRIVFQKECPCCNKKVKRHACQHTLCDKSTCKVYQKKIRSKNSRAQLKDSTKSQDNEKN